MKNVHLYFHDGTYRKYCIKAYDAQNVLNIAGGGYPDYPSQHIVIKDYSNDQTRDCIIDFNNVKECYMTDINNDGAFNTIKYMQYGNLWDSIANDALDLLYDIDELIEDLLFPPTR